MHIGTQLFGVLSATRDDPMTVIRTLRGIGYHEIEICLSMEPIPGFERVAWTPSYLQEHTEEIRAMGLTISAAHIFHPSPILIADQLAVLARSCGITAFVVKCPGELTEISLQQAAINYMTLADILKDAGAEVLVHNESADLKTRFHGVTAYERLLELCQGKVYAEVDVGWALHGGEDPLRLMARIAPLMRMIHFKDLLRTEDGFTETVIGAGSVDTAACLQFARGRNLKLLMDMDGFQGDWKEELSKSLAYVQGLSQYRDGSVSYLNILDTETGEVKTLASYEGVIEAPNWMQTEGALLYNAGGRIHKYNLDSGEDIALDTGEINNCNNDHVLSPDGSELAVSHMTFGPEGFTSRVYALPLSGGEGRLITPASPSFLHGWSPDGQEFAYCAFREIDGERQVDVYVQKEGENEVRLTEEGFNDGPEYSPDGEWIYYNSTASGLMQIWRMRRDGSGKEQLTENQRNNWFAHISPDGSRAVYLSYPTGLINPSEHLPNMPVELWLMSPDGKNSKKCIGFFGGQGSINVNSWSPDNRHLAFVSYEVNA